MTEWGRKFRIYFVVFLLASAWLGLAARLVFLHLGENQSVLSRIQDIREIEQPILVGRGRIMDCHGNILALDLAVKNVCVDPKLIQEQGHQQFVSQQLGRLLELDPAMVAARVNRPDRRFEYIKKFVKEAAAKQLSSLHMKGGFFEDVS